MTDPNTPEESPKDPDQGIKEDIQGSDFRGARTQEGIMSSTTREAISPPSGVPAQKTGTQEAATEWRQGPKDGYERGGRDNIDLIKALFLGMVTTAIFYEVFPIPFLDQGRMLALFQNDNWVSPMIVGMTFWSLFLLGFKLLHFRFQNRIWQHFRSAPIAALLGGRIYARDVDRVVPELRAALTAQKAKRFEESIIFRRVLRVLSFVRAATKIEGLDSLLDYQGQIDMKRLETSYTVLQVFIWAIPILGFIGTVLGIGFSVNEFAQFIQSAEAGGQFTAQMRAALGGVTGGLAVAFNTTFLALVLVIPVMLLTSFLNKNEEEFLLEIEEYCMEELLPRLRVTPGEDVTSEGFDEHLHKIMRLSETWLGQFEPLVEQLSRQTQMMSHQLTGIQPLVKAFTDQLMRRPDSAPSERDVVGGGVTDEAQQRPEKKDGAGGSPSIPESHAGEASGESGAESTPGDKSHSTPHSE